MSGVDNMIYMYSTSQTSGSQMQLHVDFDVTTDPSNDQVLDQPAVHAGPVAAARRCHQPGRDGHEVRDEPAGAVRALLAEGHLRRALPQQLRLRQHQRPDDARPRRRPGADLRRRPVRHPALGQSRHPGEARHHGERDRQRAAGPEHREPGRPGRRRARAAGPGVHLRGARAGPPGERRGVRERRGPGQARRLPGAGEGRGAGGARGADLQRARPPQRAPRGDHRHLPAARLERHRHHEGRDAS